MREILARAPQTIGPRRLAAEAAEMMERYKITALLVIDEARRVVCALNMRILRRAEVV